MITGPEPLLVLEAADAVRARAREEGCAEHEVFEADGRDFDWDPLQATFHAPSLFSARRVIELRMPTARSGKAGAEMRHALCANAPADEMERKEVGGTSCPNEKKRRESS